MMDFLNFMFSGFWTFVGCWLLIGLVGRILILIAFVLGGWRRKGGA